MARKPGPGLDREQVLAAAAALADEEGWEQLSLARLAERLDIRTPSLYNHVTGLEGLRRDLALLSARELLARMTQAAVGQSRGELIASIGLAYRRYAHEHPGLYPATLRAPDPEDAELQAVAQEILKLLLDAVGQFGLEDEAALHAVRALRSLAHGFVALEAAGAFGLPLDLNDSYVLLLRMFRRSLED